LRLAGENVLPLDALSLPLTADDLEAAAASVFFLQTAKRSDPRFAPDSEAREAIARICQITAGVPLAIELAAASVGILSPTEIAHTLEQSHDFILGARRDLAPRHQSLCAAFESSWRLLDSEERRAFRRLSVFRTRFDSDSAEAVAGAELALLARLVEVSLVRRPARGQFEILEVLRQFAEDKLVTNASEAAEVRRRHREYFLQRLTALAGLPEGPDRNIELERLAQHTTDLRAAWVDATNDSALDDLQRAAPGFFSLLQARGRSDEGATLFASAAAAARLTAALKPSNAAIANAALARLITRQASFITDLGRISEASELLAEGLTLLRAERQPDHEEIALAVFKQCNLARAKGEFTSPVFVESIELYRALGNQPGIARAMNALGAARQALGDYAEAKRLYQECVQIWRSVGLDGEAWAALNNLSGLAHDEGDTPAARRILEAELEATRRRNNPRALSFLLTNLAYLCNAIGDRAAAETYLREGIQISRNMGYRPRLAYALNTLGYIQMDTGDAASGATFREALRVALETEEEPVVTSILIGIARLLSKRGDTERALVILRAVAAHPSCDEQTRGSVKSLISELDPGGENSVTAIPLHEAVSVAQQVEEPKMPAR
jgi:tetratricopeptide (TPR) repeat protein